MPKVSVLVAVYNAEKYLRACLESLLNQSLKDIVAERICREGRAVESGDTGRKLGHFAHSQRGFGHVYGRVRVYG